MPHPLIAFLLLAALVCFLFAAAGVPEAKRPFLGWLGLALVTLLWLLQALGAHI